jgi:hypothetical protein
MSKLVSRKQSVSFIRLADEYEYLMALAGRNIGRLISKKRQFTNLRRLKYKFKRLSVVFYTKVPQTAKEFVLYNVQTGVNRTQFFIALAEESHYWRISISYFQGNPQELTLKKGKIVNLFYC